MTGIHTYFPALVVVLRVLHAFKVGNEVVNIFLLEAALSLARNASALGCRSPFQGSCALVIPSQWKEKCLTIPSSSLFQLVIDKYLVLLGC
jgi:hypothetical protein